jgi:O-antigen/teichoic acid export membrane protein
VAITIGAQANASFTAALLLATFVNIIPVHLSTVLFALVPGDEVRLHLEVKRTMRLCLFLALVSAPAFALTARLLLGLFGSSYQDATGALIVLGFTTYPLAIKAHYAAIARVRGRMQRAAFWTIAAAFLEIGLATAGGYRFGLTGVAGGYFAALGIESVFFFPTVFRVIRPTSSPRHRIRHHL